MLDIKVQALFYTNIKSCHTHGVSEKKREEKGGCRGVRTPSAAPFHMKYQCSCVENNTSVQQSH